MKSIKFTLCHRVTVFNYTHVTFTEEDLAESSEMNWDTFKKTFPFEIGTHTENDPQTNWIEEWDTEGTVNLYESWDFNPWVKSEIVRTFSE